MRNASTDSFISRADLRNIAHDLFEDRDGLPWIHNPQRGWVRCDPNGRSAVAARLMRTLLRFRGKHRAACYRIAKRLEGPEGWWATHTLDIGYASTGDAYRPR